MTILFKKVIWPVSSFPSRKQNTYKSNHGSHDITNLFLSVILAEQVVVDFGAYRKVSQFEKLDITMIHVEALEKSAPMPS